ncbi:MAG: outer membrane protein assembly factor BamA [Bacteroidales bacterium]|nr:outer membrane protein assembly factor BamA [Bacteroidales bacterium]
MKLTKFILFIFLLSFQLLNAQTINLNYLSPKEYEVGGIEIEGADHLDKNSVILLAGISVGEKIFLPSDKTSIAIDKLWKQGIFEDIQISVSKVEGKTIFLTYHFKTKPRLSGYKIEGVKRAEADKLSEIMNIYAGDVVTENLKSNCINIIAEHFIEKGFFSTNIEIEEIKDTNFNRNEAFLKFKINKGEKIRISQINIKGNNYLADKKIRSKMKDTKIYRWWRIWKSSRFVDEDFQADKELVISKYNDEGFRDAKIIRDSVYLIDSFKRNFWGKKKPVKEVAIDLEVYEGAKFFFRDITWVGNTKYSSEDLSKRLRIQKGDPYNKGLLEKNLNYDPTGTDIYSLYTDDGYLFFRVMPTEIKVENDSIDIEMRVYEGKQARIGKVNISGNTITNDYVIRRELRTYPGDLFSRDAVYRSLREIQQLGFFDPEKIVPDIRPNPESGTVDIDYQLVEKSSSQFDLSGGIGGGYVIFQAGISLTNFSTQKFFDKKAWNPFPIGDGQKLSLRVQTNGDYYHAVSLSFTEPWLGGRKPNALSVGVYYSYQDDGFWNTTGTSEYYIGILGGSVSLATRLKWPDDYFTFVHGLAYQQYNVKNYTTLTAMPTGISNNINYNFTLARNSVDQLIYPRQGSDISLAAQMTFPYSLVNGKDYSSLSPAERYKWLEYYKINFRAAWYFNLFDDLVVSTRARFGFLGQYNSKVGYSPFERFYVGGDGLTGYNLDGRELVALRGYDESSLSPDGGGMVFDKYTMELRYPITLNEGASVYALAFFEAGNSWANFQSFEPFKMYRSLGVGLRIHMPMFGLLGVDWGYGLVAIPGDPTASGSHFHISINNSID